MWGTRRKYCTITKLNIYLRSAGMDDLNSISNALNQVIQDDHEGSESIPLFGRCYRSKSHGQAVMRPSRNLSNPT